MTMTMPDFLTNWTFWSFVVAAIAVALSQLQPVELWFRKPSLDLEVHSRMSVTHLVGNPNAQLHVIVINTGGRPVRIRGMSVSFTRNGEHRFTLPVQNYLEFPNDEANVLFTPFVLEPGEEWSHIANFLNYFTRQDERAYRQMESAIRSDINERRRRGPADQNQLVEAGEDIVRPIVQFFDQRFDWLEGEYEMTLEVSGDMATCVKNYDFTIFESESEELRSLSDHYKYGSGIFWNRPDVVAWLGVPIHETNA